MPRKPHTRTAARASLAALALATVAAFVAPHAGSDGSGSVAKAGTAQARPNIVVVMTDDQDVEALEVMDTVQTRLASEGTTFSRFFASYPLCCPSRATFFTGRYAHNHGVLHNQPPRGGFEAFDDSSTLATDLESAGYRTGYFGKYLNGYGEEGRGNDPRYVPPGWTDWHAKVAGLYFNVTLNEKGQLNQYGEDEYSTDLLARKAAGFIGDSAPDDRPFFMMLSTAAAHLDDDKPPVPAPRHEGAFAGEPLPRPPSFNERNVSDKPAFVRNVDPLNGERIDWFKRVHRGRLESLLAVDDAVGRILRRLEREGELDNTLVIYTSDHGFLEGEHRLRKKKLFYEESIGVPLIMRGPGVPQGETHNGVAGNIDLAPTILQAAGAPSTRVMDGRPLLPLTADGAASGGHDVLLENTGSTGVRTRRYMYAEHKNGEKELYDLRVDPFQLRSRHSDPDYHDEKQELRERLEVLRGCAGAACR